MSDSYERVGDVALWKNATGKGRNRPAYTGSVEIDGKTYKLALWINQSQNKSAPQYNGSVEIKVEDNE